jgi:hypothetical protein
MAIDPTEKNHLELWQDFHIREILKEIKQAGIELIPEKIPQIIEETSYRVRSKKHPEKCPYYNDDPKTKEKARPCHDLVFDLNCFLCACPEYQNQKSEGGCNLDCKLGKWFEHKDLPLGKIWDCTECCVPHFPTYVEDYLKHNLERLRREFGE